MDSGIYLFLRCVYVYVTCCLKEIFGLKCLIRYLEVKNEMNDSKRYFRRNCSVINHRRRCLIKPDKLLGCFYIMLQQVWRWWRCVITTVLDPSSLSRWTPAVTASSTLWKMLLKVKSVRVLWRRSRKTPAQKRSPSI